MKSPVVVRPRAQRDLDDQAVYLAEQASPATGNRFLIAAEATFALLASQPLIGWHPNVKRPKALESLRMFTISGFEKMMVLYRPAVARDANILSSPGIGDTTTMKTQLRNLTHAVAILLLAASLFAEIGRAHV